MKHCASADVPPTSTVRYGLTGTAAMGRVLPAAPPNSRRLEPVIQIDRAGLLTFVADVPGHQLPFTPRR
jgi:hypothetical protein